MWAFMDEPFIQEGATVPVLLNRFDEGSLFRYETRGSVMRMTVNEMSDPRFEGSWSGIGNSDEYRFSTSQEPLFGLARVLMRMEDDEGAWQVTGDEPYLPGVPQPEWAMAVMTGEGAYEGLTALVANRFRADPCGWDVQGLLFKGEPPSMPEWLEPPAE